MTLDAWTDAFNAPAGLELAAFGDSITKGGTAVTNGGPFQLLREYAATRWGEGSDGLNPPNRHWTYTTGGDAWTLAGPDDVWDCAPMAYGNGADPGSARMANGASKVATWTKPSGVTAESFYLYVVDAAGAGNFSYSTDGGISWADVTADRWLQDNRLRRIVVPARIITALEIRAATAAGTAVNVYLVGVQPNTDAPGLTLHNLGAAGESTWACIRESAGNWHAFLDLVQPELCTIMFTNDSSWILSNYETIDLYQSNLDAFATQVESHGGLVLFLNYMEQNHSATIEKQMRTAAKVVAQDHHALIIDFADLTGSYADTVAAGLQKDGDIHPTNAGAVFMAQQIWKMIARSGHGVFRETAT